jgi:putative transposase
MSLDPDLFRRKSIRLRARDYSLPGFYFVTLCTHERRFLFGDIVDGVMHLNCMGRAVESCWRDIPRHYPHAALDEFVVMPNHIHGVIQIYRDAWEPAQMPVRAVGIPIVPGLVMLGANISDNRTDVLDVGANNYLPLQPNLSARRSLTRSKLFPMGHGTSRTIGSMIRGFKIGVTRWARLHGHQSDVWQRNYHDHIIRNEHSLERVRRYIRANPANWARDRQNPDRRV